MRYGRVALIAAPGLLWAVAVFLAVAASLDPDQYFRYSHQEAEPFVYPAREVAWLVGIFLVELAVLYGVLRPWATPITLLRLVVCLGLFAAWLWVCGFLVIHAPGFILVHLIWVFLVTVVLSGAVVILGFIQLWAFTRSRYAA